MRRIFAMKGVVKKSFPFALDGISVTVLNAGDDFPPAGYKVTDQAFQGLVDAKFVEQTSDGEGAANEDINRRIIEAIDRRLDLSSDEELKEIIARRGAPFSGNLVHAVLVGEAKAQLLAEFEGTTPVRGVDANSGVTEQPLAAPGAPTPPSAAAAVEQQQAQADAASQQNGAEGTGESEVKVLSEAELNAMNKADLEAYAADRKIDISGAKTKADIVAALTAK
jgi:hypothetical protein